MSWHLQYFTDLCQFGPTKQTNFLVDKKVCVPFQKWVSALKAFRPFSAFIDEEDLHLFQRREEALADVSLHRRAWGLCESEGSGRAAVVGDQTMESFQ